MAHAKTMNLKIEDLSVSLSMAKNIDGVFCHEMDKRCVLTAIMIQSHVLIGLEKRQEMIPLHS